MDISVSGASACNAASCASSDARRASDALINASAAARVVFCLASMEAMSAAGYSTFAPS